MGLLFSNSMKFYTYLPLIEDSSSLPKRRWYNPWDETEYDVRNFVSWLLSHHAQFSASANSNSKARPFEVLNIYPHFLQKKKKKNQKNEINK